MSSLKNFSAPLDGFQQMGFKCLNEFFKNSKTVTCFSCDLKEIDLQEKVRKRSEFVKTWRKKNREKDEFWKFFIEFEDQDSKTTFNCFGEGEEFNSLGCEQKEWPGDEDCETEDEEIRDSASFLCWQVEMCVGKYFL
jgi:hypothetical protein